MPTQGSAMRVALKLHAAVIGLGILSPKMPHLCRGAVITRWFKAHPVTGVNCTKDTVTGSFQRALLPEPAGDRGKRATPPSLSRALLSLSGSAKAAPGRRTRLARGP